MILAPAVQQSCVLFLLTEAGKHPQEAIDQVKHLLRSAPGLCRVALVVKTQDRSCVLKLGRDCWTNIATLRMNDLEKILGPGNVRLYYE